MPSLGADMEAGTLVEWLVKPGDEVASRRHRRRRRDAEGRDRGRDLRQGHDRRHPRAGRRKSSGRQSARAYRRRKGGGRRRLRAAPPARAGRRSAPAPVLRPAVKPAPAPQAAPSGRIKATPVARRRAAELGVDLSRVTGTGLQGSIRLADVEGFRPAEAPRAARWQVRRRRNAQGDRRRDEPVETRDSALLFERYARSGARSGVARIFNAEQAPARSSAARRRSS